ncbi:hypothetical protein A2U01_0084825, partial [Trifolium medium]|nr:hypothetical protein [Trifolium medium]
NAVLRGDYLFEFQSRGFFPRGNGDRGKNSSEDISGQELGKYPPPLRIPGP